MLKLLCAVSLFGLIMVGCPKDEGGTAEKPAAAKAEKGGGGEAAGEIGIAECDEYIKKMRECLKKMPDEAKAATEAGFKQTVDAWKQAATNAAAKDSLAQGCKAALDGLAANPACK